MVIYYHLFLKYILLMFIFRKIHFSSDENSNIGSSDKSRGTCTSPHSTQMYPDGAEGDVRHLPQPEVDRAQGLRQSDHRHLWSRQWEQSAIERSWPQSQQQSRDDWQRQSVFYRVLWDEQGLVITSMMSMQINWWPTILIFLMHALKKSP